MREARESCTPPLKACHPCAHLHAGTGQAQLPRLPPCMFTCVSVLETILELEPQLRAQRKIANVVNFRAFMNISACDFAVGAFGTSRMCCSHISVVVVSRSDGIVTVSLFNFESPCVFSLSLPNTTRLR